MKPTLNCLSLIGALAGATLIGMGSAAGAGKPDVIPITSFDVGNNVYAEVTAISDAISGKFGTKVRVIPLGNEVVRALVNGGAKPGQRGGLKPGHWRKAG